MTLEGDFNLQYFYVYMQFVFWDDYCRTKLCFFLRVLQNVIELKPKAKYILAVDDSKNTLEDIVQVTWMTQDMKENG